MRTKGNAFLAAAALGAVTVVMVVQSLPPSPLPADAPATEFSAERALEHIRAMAGEPRPTGSPANAAARTYILAALEALGLEAETQRDGDLENVLARIAGTHSHDAILLTAHLDSVAEGPGATDDGSGVAVLLETGRALASGPPLRNTVIFLFTDSEEEGTIGARAFIARHPWARDVKVVVGFDAGGLSGPSVLTATSAENGWLIRQLAQADPYLTGSSAINALADSGTDFGHAFKPAGFSGYAFDLYWDRRIHTPDDNIQNVSRASLQQQGFHALRLARHFGNLDQLADPREADAVYFNVLRLFTVSYPSTWAIPLAIAVAAVFCGTLALGLRKQVLTWGGMAYGALVLVGGVIIAPLPGILVGIQEPGMPLRYVGRSLDQPSQVSAVALAALILTALWYSLSDRFRRTSLVDLAMGALWLMLAGTVGTSVAFPALSFAFTWPLWISLFACLNWFYGRVRLKVSRTVFAGLLVSGAASVVVLGPTIVLGLFDQMTLTLLLLGVLCGFLAPLIHLMLGRAQ